MPLYQFSCQKCDHREDFIKPLDDRNIPEVCSKCGGEMLHDEVAGKPLFRLGAGFWYRNNYENNSQKELEAALRENDAHQRSWDKRQKLEEGLL